MSLLRHREALQSSLAALRANKLRSFLTALGLVIGNASVILVVTISLTSRDYILDAIQRIGSNLIIANYEAGNNGATATTAGDYLKVADVEAVRQQLGSRIVAATGVMNSLDRMRVEGHEEDVAILGADQYYPAVRNLALLTGRFFDGSEVQQRAHVALPTEKLARRLFGSQAAAMGRKVKLHGLPFTIIGSFKEKVSTFGQSELSGDNILIPITVLKDFTQIERIDPLYVQVRSQDGVESATTIVRAIIESRHRPGAHYNVMNLNSILDTARQIATILDAVLIVVSAIALIISGIGIMNIMLVTVTERTREIGLRMAVGAARRDILEQFLAEAVLISIGGGTVGILIGVAVPLSVRYLTDEFAIPISFLSIAVAFTVSLAVGLIFGLLPASRASRLNPTEALRYE
ncbi:MAG TPA: ABC transporter permease [Bryobacteraceae bacterium]|nr:ABC transporter permease [Bryobacteraceae bacterium]